MFMKKVELSRFSQLPAFPALIAGVIYGLDLQPVN